MSQALTTSVASQSASVEKPTFKKAYVHFLAEHKSVLDKWTVLQMLGFQLRIWERLKRRGEPLGPIIPILIYHGERMTTGVVSRTRKCHAIRTRSRRVR